jgi:hypothetical protein
MARGTIILKKFGKLALTLFSAASAAASICFSWGGHIE